MQGNTFPMSRASYTERLILTILSVLAVGVLLTVSFLFLYHADPSILQALLIIAVPAIICYMVWLELLRMYSQCRITREGLTLLRPLLPNKHFPWTAFQAANICYRDGGRGPKPVVLCFVRYGERKNLFGRWRTGNPFRCYRLICPEFSEALHKTAQQHCPLEIVDLRNTPDYINS